MSSGVRARWLGAAAWALALLAAGPASGAEPAKAALWYVGEPAGSAWKGAQQGLIEANLAGQFAGYEFELRPADPNELQAAEDILIVLADLPAEAVEALSAELQPVLVFNLTATEDRLREICRPNLFNVIPSDRMKADALQQWRSVNPDGEAEAAGWNHNFRKYSSRDTNRRFLTEQGERMDDAAWAGWAAVKMAGEALLRTRTADPEQLRVYVREELSFDGSKGFPLTFRETGQLRQPIWIVRDERVIAEAPIEGAVEDHDDLDTLGLARCP
jgi:ABC-type branched-subunit amino acid transport system substrate-binding protein